MPKFDAADAESMIPPGKEGPGQILAATAAIPRMNLHVLEEYALKRAGF